VQRVEIHGFPGANIGCQNCRDARIEHARVRCDSGGRGFGVAMVVNQNWPAGLLSSGHEVSRVDAQECTFGVLVSGVADSTFTHNHASAVLDGMWLVGSPRVTVTHNRIVRAARNGLHLLGSPSSTVAFNHLVENPVGVRVAASAGTAVEHNLDFGNTVFIVGGEDDSTVTVPADPAGW
jgi:hypothetical protein